MTKSKKALSLVLAIVMVFSIFAINAFAATETATFTVSTNATSTTTINDEITVTVTGSTDYFVGPTSIPVTYDSSKFAFVAGSVQPAALFGTVAATETAVNTATAGMVWVTITPKSANSPIAQKLNNTVVMTFKLKVTAAGASSIAISDDQKTTTNTAGKLYCGSLSSSDVNNATVTAMGQTINRTPASVTIAGGSATPELAIKAGYATSGIIIDSNKKFGAKYAGVVYGFTLDATIDQAFYTTRLEATNGGTIEIVKTPYVSRPVSYGTGATVVVKNSTGSVVKTYVIVLFGDVNGNGKVGPEDTGAIYDHCQGTTLITDSVKIMAANTVVSGRTDALKATSLYQVKPDDTGAVYDLIQGKSSFNPVTAAASHNLYNTYYQ